MYNLNLCYIALFVELSTYYTFLEIKNCKFRNTHIFSWTEKVRLLIGTLISFIYKIT